MSFLYIGTFGSFIGFSFALPLVIKNTFPEFLAGHPFIATYLAGLGFVGALIGSLSRPLGGWLSDRSRHRQRRQLTLVVFVGMAAFTVLAIGGVQGRSFPIFFGSYMVIFLLSGMGNGSTYRMIPSIFARLGAKEAEANGLHPKETAVEFKRRAAGVIGIVGAIGAFGGLLIQVVLRQASLDVSALVKAAQTPAEKVAIAPPMPTGRYRPCGSSSGPTWCSPASPGSSTSGPGPASPRRSEPPSPPRQRDNGSAAAERGWGGRPAPRRQPALRRCSGERR